MIGALGDLIGLLFSGILIGPILLGIYIWIKM